MADDDRREKKSWRELDRLREKGRSSSDRDRERPPRGGAGASAQSVAQKSYRAALERAFESGTLAELAKTLSRTNEPPVPKAPPPAPPAPVAAAPAPAEGGAASAPAAPPATPPPTPVDPERENRQKALVKIREAEGRDAITRAVDAFLKSWPKLPDDFEVLTKALAHKDDARVLDTLDRLEALLARDKPRRARSLQAQLRMLEETHGDPDLRKRAAAVRAKL
jgi:hypothetical protein